MPHMSALFMKAKNRDEQNGLARQILLVPEIIEMPNEDCERPLGAPQAFCNLASPLTALAPML